MNKSESIAQLVNALALAQPNFEAIGKDKTAAIKSDKGTFTYHYADLASAMDATRPALNAQGLVVMQPVRSSATEIVVTSILAHKSGEWISEEMTWPAGRDPKAMGAAVTYAKRHGYLAIIGACPEEEDTEQFDAARGKPSRQKPEPRPVGGSEAARQMNERIAQSGTAVPGKEADRLADVSKRLVALGVTDGPARLAQVGEVIGKPFDGKALSVPDWKLMNDWLRKEETARVVGEIHAKANAEFDQR